MPINVGVLTVSDRSASSERPDVSGQVLADGLRAAGYSVVRRAVVADERDRIAEILVEWCSDCTAIITTGGTGFAARDVTPEATLQVIERRTPGISEALRAYGLARTTRAALSRGEAGIRGSTLIINLPGSPKAVAEGLEVLLPILGHGAAVLLGEPADH